MVELVNKIKEFFSTPKGKMVGSIGGGFIGFVILVFAVYYLVLGSMPEIGDIQGTVSPIDTGEVVKETTQVSEAVTQGFEVYGFKDPFVKLETDDTEESTETADEENAAVISLKGISFEEGKPVAQLVYNGEIEDTGEGESVGDSPYLVLEIKVDEVKLLYGDDIIALSLGEEFVGVEPEED